MDGRAQGESASLDATSASDEALTTDKVDKDLKRRASSPTSVASGELDDAYNVYRESADVPVEAEEDTKVRRRIDLQIMPLLIITYTLQYLDKNSLNFASVYGLQEAIGLDSQRYSWVGSIFYVRIP